MRTNFIKKTVTAIMALAIVGGTLPYTVAKPLFNTSIVASADDEWSTLEFSDGVLTLKDVVSREEVLNFKYKTTVTKIVCAPETTLPANCNSLFANYKASEIDLSNAAKNSKIVDMGKMFYGCSNLKNLNFEGLSTSDVKSMTWMFYACQSLTSFNLSQFDTSNVTDMSQLFYGCSSLESVDLTEVNTSNVQLMNNMFYGCSSLTSIDVSGIDTSSATNMSGMFSRCSKLEHIDVSTFDTSSVTNMEEMFYGCTKLKFIDVSSLDTSNVTNMVRMFSNCAGAESINLGGMDTSNVTTMLGMFEGCKGLNTLDLGSLNTSNVTSMKEMFSNCNNLVAMDLSSLDTSSVTDMTNLFIGCESLIMINLGNLDTGNVKNFNNTFRGCKSLESLDLSGIDTSSCTTFGGMFYGCDNLASVDISNFNTANVTDFGNMFTGCKKLKSVDLSKFNTKSAKNFNYMFDGCQILENVELSTFDTSNATSMYCMFRNCYALKTVDVSSFNTENVNNMSAMFERCSQLSNLDLSHFIVKSGASSNSMFNGCTNLMPDIVSATSTSATLDGSIGMNFYIKPCDNLAKVVLSGPNGDTTITDFSGCIQEDGQYKLTYHINAAQGFNDITMKAYDRVGRRLLVCGNNYTLLDHSQSVTMLDNYLKSVANNNNDEKLKNLVNSLRTYCIVADSYFNKASAYSSAPVLSDEDNELINASEMKDETGVCKISMVLDSDTAIRIYYSGEENTAMYGNTTLKAKTSKYGKYFEITGIRAYQFADEKTITIGDKKVSFSTLSYIGRVLNNPESTKQLTSICKWFYAYGKAAKEYKLSLEEA